MAKKKKSDVPINDFACEDELDICGFSDTPVLLGECISSFSFDDSSSCEESETKSTNLSKENTINEIKPIDSNNVSLNLLINSNSSNTNTSSIKTTSNSRDTLPDNRRAPIVNGCAPPVDGEYLDVKRTYMLRSSTVRKLNELKSIHPDLNTYVSSIVDMAIDHYYNHVINGGSQT
ncbi:hypothetical protein ACN077_16880 [Clostridium chromiireducens]|uniref:hypothetical protein n=1 Tax=Clostridium chromiireducens TaxID=225345 RepID=UPI003AF583D7